MSSSTVADERRGREWLTDWNPEDAKSWDSKLAWRTMWITTFALTLAFSTWFLASAFAPILANLGYT
ncbi:MAG: MFS transporter, partial [Actinomycetes bacterium]